MVSVSSVRVIGAEGLLLEPPRQVGPDPQRRGVGGEPNEPGGHLAVAAAAGSAEPQGEGLSFVEIGEPLQGKPGGLVRADELAEEELPGLNAPCSRKGRRARPGPLRGRSGCGVPRGGPARAWGSAPGGRGRRGDARA